MLWDSGVEIENRVLYLFHWISISTQVHKDNYLKQGSIQTYDDFWSRYVAKPKLHKTYLALYNTVRRVGVSYFLRYILY